MKFQIILLIFSTICCLIIVIDYKKRSNLYKNSNLCTADNNKIKLKEDDMNNSDLSMSSKSRSTVYENDFVVNIREKQESSNKNNLQLVSIHIRAHTGLHINELVPLMLSLGLRYGEMKIFHRYDEINDKKRILFSIASLEKPGQIDINNENLQLPGLAIFFNAACNARTENMRIYDSMIGTARKIVELQENCELFNAKHLPLSTDDIQKQRHKLLTYEQNS